MSILKNIVLKNIERIETILLPLLSFLLLIFFASLLTIKSAHIVIIAIFFIINIFVFILLPKNKFKLEDELLFDIFIIYIFIMFALNIYHGEKLREFEHPLKIFIAINLLYIWRKYPPNATFLFAAIASGTILGAINPLYDCFILNKYRPSNHLNPIVYGDLILLFTTLSLFGFNYIKSFNKLYWRIMYCLLIIMAILLGTIATLVSGSRGAWLAIPINALLFFIFYGYKNNKATLIAITFILSLLIICYFLPQTGVKIRLIEIKNNLRDFFMFDNKNSSIGYRLQMWQMALPMIIEKPFLGWGEQGSNLYRKLLLQNGSINNELYNIGHFHNLFIEQWVKRGLLGLLSLLSLFIVPLWLFLRRISIYSIAATITICSYIIYSTSDIAWIYGIATSQYIFLLLMFWCLQQQLSIKK